jgi:hypothetical protein
MPTYDIVNFDSISLGFSLSLHRHFGHFKVALRISSHKKIMV